MSHRKMWRTHRKTDGMSSTIEIKVVTNYEYVTKKDMLKRIYSFEMLHVGKASNIKRTHFRSS